MNNIESNDTIWLEACGHRKETAPQSMAADPRIKIVESLIDSAVPEKVKGIPNVKFIDDVEGEDGEPVEVGGEPRRPADGKRRRERDEQLEVREEDARNRGDPDAPLRREPTRDDV